MTNGIQYAQFEIKLDLGRDDGVFDVDFTGQRPNDDSLDRPVGTPVARFDRTLLDTLMDDEQYRAYGRQLGAALLADAEVKAAFDGLRNQHNVQFRLVIGPRAEDLHTLAWETLCHPDTERPLFEDDSLVFARFLSSKNQRSVGRRAKGELSALVCVANPRPNSGYNLEEIAVADEIRRAQGALRGIHPETLPADPEAAEPVTLDRLLDLLRRPGKPIDILYLVCHGRLHNDEPILYFEDEDGAVKPISGASFAADIGGLAQPPQLVVLASCESAGVAPGIAAAHARALTGVGPLLGRAGVPAVLAMHGRITMPTASAFVQKFFEELDDHGQVDRAAAAARKQVREAADFWMPVLFTRLKSGRLWYTAGFGGADGGFHKMKAVAANVRAGKCLVVLGPRLLEPLIGTPQDLARLWAGEEGYALEGDARRDPAQVAKDLALNQDDNYMLQQLFQVALPAALTRRLRDDLPAHLRQPQTLGNFETLLSEARRILQRQDPSELELHTILAKLPFPIYLTANADRLLEDALEQDTTRGVRSELFRWPPNPKDPDSSRTIPANHGGPLPAAPAGAAPEPPLVYHLMGRYDRPRSLVLTEDNYFDFLIGSATNRQQIPLAVRKALNSNALLFLGFHFDDWDFRALFRTIIWHRRSASWKERTDGWSEGADQGDGWSDDELSLTLTHVAVQLEPEAGPGDDASRARQYFEELFRRADIGTNVNIYWGDTASFLRDLWRTWNQPSAATSAAAAPAPGGQS